MKQINLKTNSEKIERKTKISLSLVLGLLLLIITGAIVGGLFLYDSQLKKRISLIEDDIDVREKEIDEQGFREIYDLQGRIIDIEKYSSEASNKKECLNLIASRTFGDTVFEDIKLSEKSSSSSSVEADILVANNDKLTSQLNAYEQSDNIENLRLNNSSLEERGITASISFLVKTSLDSEEE